VKSAKHCGSEHRPETGGPALFQPTATLAAVLEQAPALGTGKKRLVTHQPPDAVQSTGLALLQHIASHVPGAVGAVAPHETLAH